MKKNIILIGYMGCGKTTVGKSLARLESAIFLDTDERIEEKQGRTISEIFAQDSEKAFRDMETAYLKELLRLKREGMIVSTYACQGRKSATVARAGICSLSEGFSRNDI